MFIKDLDKIIILGKGPSRASCPDLIKPGTEIWGVTNVFIEKGVSRLFEMHSRETVEAGFKQYGGNYAMVNKLGFPVYTRELYPEYDNNEVYPLADVVREFGVRYFMNSLSYMIALAIMQRPKEMELLGVDMRCVEDFLREKACVEFWLGVAVGRGIKVKTSDISFVMASALPDRNMFYGYEPGQAEGIIDGRHERETYRRLGA